VILRLIVQPGSGYADLVRSSLSVTTTRILIALNDKNPQHCYPGNPKRQALDNLTVNAICSFIALMYFNDTLLGTVQRPLFA